ncbi:peroxidase 31 [Elaeis guineensis]|uniref:Peroxidase n=1 Tax=Elaeis guineensis var. tenera TaxID=51953 RepID=A0A6I9RLW3_ELAGV|nr:peroxidase 31 [Elaeis guineensis]
MASHLQHRAHSFSSALLAAVLAVAVALSLPAPSAAKLTPNYYRKTCPRAAEIVTQVVTGKQIANPTTAAGTLRLFFHDCFVGGCDASVLISTNAFNRAERDADINLSLPGDGFDVVVRAKTQLEIECPGIVSCSDVLALATRDLVTMLGGPFYPVLLGRKDALASKADTVEGNLPRPNMTVSQMISIFAAKGFTVQEMVALSGAHTVGFSHCKEFAHRIYNHNNGGQNAFDPSMNPKFAEALQKACANYIKDETIATFNDIMTPGKFDNMYFKNLARGLGLLASDQLLMSDPRTKPFVQLYAANNTAFFNDFAHAMVKLSVYGVKTGRKGEVRRRCDNFNN